MNAYEFLNWTKSTATATSGATVTFAARAGRGRWSSLVELRERLVREARQCDGAEGWSGWLHRVALEAEAQAWLTTEPLLTFPLLFEEKVAAARAYLARQQRLRTGNPRAG